VCFYLINTSKRNSTYCSRHSKQQSMIRRVDVKSKLISTSRSLIRYIVSRSQMSKIIILPIAGRSKLRVRKSSRRSRRSCEKFVSPLREIGLTNMEEETPRAFFIFPSGSNQLPLSARLIWSTGARCKLDLHKETRVAQSRSRMKIPLNYWQIIGVGRLRAHPGDSYLLDRLPVSCTSTLQAGLSVFHRRRDCSRDTSPLNFAESADRNLLFAAIPNNPCGRFRTDQENN